MQAALTCAMLLAAFSPAPSPAASSAPRLVTLGDSITYGQSASDVKETSYPALLARSLGATLVNLGIQGETGITDPQAFFGLEIGLMRRNHIQGVLTDEVPCIPPDASIVTLYIGANDLWVSEQLTKPDFSNAATLFPQVASAFARSMADIVAGIRRRAPAARIVIATNVNPADKGSIVEKVKEPELGYRKALTGLVRAMNAAVAATGAVVVNLGCDPALYDLAKYATIWDLHPNDMGHARIAEDFLDAIRRGGRLTPCVYNEVFLGQVR